MEDGYVLPPPPSMGTPGEGVWREGKTLIMSKDAVLPDRCVKCNAYAEGRLTRKFSWHHPAYYFLILVAWIIYLAVALAIRKRATVELGLCDEHKAKRRTFIWITILLVLGGIAGFFLGVAAEDGMPVFIGGVLLVTALIFGIIATRVAYAHKIDDRFVWLRGINKEYLDQLPAWPGL